MQNCNDCNIAILQYCNIAIEIGSTRGCCCPAARWLLLVAGPLNNHKGEVNAQHNKEFPPLPNGQPSANHHPGTANFASTIVSYILPGFPHVGASLVVFPFRPGDVVRASGLLVFGGPPLLSVVM